MTLPNDPQIGDPGHTTAHKTIKEMLDARITTADASATYVPAVVLAGTGIDPTGVADSTAAIQAKVNAVPAAGGVVYFPAGVYKLTGTITLRRGVTIRGSGQEATQINHVPATAGYAIDTGAVAGQLDHLGIEDLSIYGGGSSSGAVYLRAGQGVQRNRLRNLTLYGNAKGVGGFGFTTGTYGIRSEQLWETQVENVTISNYHHGFHATTTNTNLYSRVRVQYCGDGYTFLGGSVNDTGVMVEMLGILSTDGSGYCIKVGGDGTYNYITMVSPFWETFRNTGTSAAAMVWVAPGSTYAERDGKYAVDQNNTGTLAATIRLDTGTVPCYFDNPDQASVLPTHIINASNDLLQPHRFINIRRTARALIPTAAITDGRVFVSGQRQITGDVANLLVEQSGGRTSAVGPALTSPDAQTITVTGGANTVASGAVDARSNVLRGKVTFGTAATPLGNDQLSLSWGAGILPFAPYVVITPINQATRNLGPALVDSSSQSGFSIRLGTTAPAASQPAGTYGYYYMVMG